MKIFITFLMLLIAMTGLGQNSYNAYVDTENGTSGNMITTTMLANSTHTNGVYGTWSITPSPHTAFWITNVNDTAVRAPFLVGSTLYNGSGDTKTFCVDVNGSSSRECQFTINSGRVGQFAIGWYWKVSPSLNLGDFVDTLHIEMNGDYAVAAYRNDSGSAKAIRIHADSSDTGSGVGPDIVVASNTTYWCTILVNTNEGTKGMARLALFNPTTWRMVGISTKALRDRNDYVEYFKFGHCNGHSASDNEHMWFDDFTIKSGPNAVTEWPLLPAGAIVQAATTSRTDFNTAYTNSTPRVGTNYDVVLLPAGNSSWSTFALNKEIVVSGSGTNVTIIQADGTINQDDEILGLYHTFMVLSNLTVRGTFHGTTHWGYGCIVRANWCRVAYCSFEKLRNPIHFQATGGCADNCLFYDTWHAGRCFDLNAGTGDTAWNSLYPIAYDSTNYCVWEHCVYDSGLTNPVADFNWSGWTAQQGDAYVVRHCDIYIRTPTTEVSPMFDQHGDISTGGSPFYLRGGLSTQIYSNRFHFTGGTGIGSVFADMRGGQALVYSNDLYGVNQVGGDAAGFTGDTIRFREEFSTPPDGSHNDRVENSYSFKNFHGSAGDANDLSVLMLTGVPNNISGFDSTPYVRVNLEFFLSAPSVLKAPPYPHPLRGGPSLPPGGGETPPSSLTFGPNVRGMLLRNGRR